ncbi:MAG: biotin--[acetyl-CoA-carboxylase] ligase [Candidatus Obscuribacterales bacterium]|nr:biotin--[acetyl-CoA-carboxylase] ligase [Candidatus Obscuribacterales bacterium]
MPEPNNNSRFALEVIEAHLTSTIVGRSKTDANEIWQVLDSTNNRASDLARAGADEGPFVLARQQTAGRGRQGKSWLSKADSGVYISFLLRPELTPASLPLLSFVAGLACAEAVERTCGLQPGLKWVNDLVFDGRKLGGILCEAPGQETKNRQQKSAVIIGIGINLDLTAIDLPAELKDRVAALDQLCGRQIDANLLVASLCSALEKYYLLLRSGKGETIIKLWKERSATLGKTIRATLADKEIYGLAADVAADGALIVRTEENKEIRLHAGEISIRLADGSYA